MTFKTAWKAACVAAALGMGATASQAAPDDFNTSFSDDYWGNAPGSYTDVVGGSSFNNTGGQVTKSGNDLTVVITTNYADTVGVNNGNEGALGTFVGSLFIGVNNTGPTINGPASAGGSAPANTADDTYVNDPGRYNYVVNPDAQFAGTNGAALDADLFALATGVGAGTDVQLSYYPNPGTTSGTSFRNDQAVGYTGNATEQLAATWSLDKSANTITFSIADFFTLNDFTSGNPLTLTVAWAMTCANDVIMYTQALAYSAVGEVPLPAGLLLLLSGLVGLGFLGRYKTKAT